VIDLRDCYGSFRAKTLCLKKRTYNIHYVLIFAKDRLMAAEIGKSYGLDEDEHEGEMFGAVMGGIIGGYLGSKSDERARRKKKEKASRLVELIPEEILRLEKENFEIVYSEIEKVEWKRRALWIEGRGVTPALIKLGWSPTEGLFRKKPRREMWFDIAPDQDFEKCKTIVSMALQSKLVIN